MLSCPLLFTMLFAQSKLTSITSLRVETALSKVHRKQTLLTYLHTCLTDCVGRIYRRCAWLRSGKLAAIIRIDQICLWIRSSQHESIRNTANPNRLHAFRAKLDPALQKTAARA